MVNSDDDETTGAVGGDDRDRTGRAAFHGRTTQEGALWVGGDEYADERATESLRRLCR